MKTIIVVALICAGVSSAALASPLTESVGNYLAQKDTEIKADISSAKFCEARGKVEEALGTIQSVDDQIAAGQPVSIPQSALPQTQASPDDVAWIIERKNELTSMQHSIRLFCP